MGKVIAFPLPPSSHPPTGGAVHAYPLGDGRFEVGHESASGGSWGGFEQFDCPVAAVAFARDANRRLYGGRCSLEIDSRLLGTGGGGVHV